MVPRSAPSSLTSSLPDPPARAVPRKSSNCSSTTTTRTAPVMLISPIRSSPSPCPLTSLRKGRCFPRHVPQFAFHPTQGGQAGLPSNPLRLSKPSTSESMPCRLRTTSQGQGRPNIGSVIRLRQLLIRPRRSVNHPVRHKYSGLRHPSSSPKVTLIFLTNEAFTNSGGTSGGTSGPTWTFATIITPAKSTRTVNETVFPTSDD